MSRKTRVRRQSTTGGRVQPVTRMDLTSDELNTLLRVSRYYLKRMGFIRYLIALTAPPDVKVRLRFIAEETRSLERFIKAAIDDLQRTSSPSTSVSFTPLALVALWGRTLASLNTPRSRRKLKSDEIIRREALAGRFEEVARALRGRSASALEAELQTRRPAEAEWIRERLGN